MAEQLIVVPLHNGAVPHGRPVHLPATRIRSDEFAPYMVDARCGLRGIVYAHGGAFQDAKVCPECAGLPETVAPVRHTGFPAGRVPCPKCGGPKAAPSKRCASCAAAERPPVTCGTMSGYSRGCRCDLCAAASRIYHRERRRRFARGRTMPASGCGTNARYQRGCRCDACREAHRVYARTYRLRAA